MDDSLATFLLDWWGFEIGETELGGNTDPVSEQLNRNYPGKGKSTL